MLVSFKFISMYKLICIDDNFSGLNNSRLWQYLYAVSDVYRIAFNVLTSVRIVVEGEVQLFRIWAVRNIYFSIPGHGFYVNTMHF